MFEGGWWRGEFGGDFHEEAEDRRLFARLARGGLLRSLPAGAEETLPLVEAALEEHFDRPAPPAPAGESSADPERDARRPGNPFPSLPPRDARPPHPFPDPRL